MAELDADYDEDMEDTPEEELMGNSTSDSVSRMQQFAESKGMDEVGTYKVCGGSCRGGCCRGNGDDCTSRATCRRGYV